jgi:hypothetical protein
LLMPSPHPPFPSTAMVEEVGDTGRCIVAAY